MSYSHLAFLLLMSQLRRRQRRMWNKIYMVEVGMHDVATANLKVKSNYM